MRLWNSNRMEREQQTLRLMIGIYCRRHRHASTQLCDCCGNLQDYAMQRLDHCRFKEDKYTCAKCPVHCYKPAMREKVRQVMRYSGPWMLVLHPVLTLLHYTDELIKAWHMKRTCTP